MCGWRETLTGDYSLLVSVMGLTIDVIKYVEEGLFRSLIKCWNQTSVRELIETIEGDTRFMAEVKRVVVLRMMDLEVEDAWVVGIIDSIE